ncbi:hypothetical protein pdam_00012114 [Pocillopora damicornis]|uniref:Uncharacterized protein n=1 Tax=Pocillopora damicornis TaxID=46731 RepID=A0A3M6UR74_POCDA|nr:hypothetical protein pdam_00012114 [Pocillopora damicornis]
MYAFLKEKKYCKQSQNLTWRDVQHIIVRTARPAAVKGFKKVEWTENKQVIDIKPILKILGATLDNKPSFKDHVTTTLKKAYARMWREDFAWWRSQYQSLPMVPEVSLPGTITFMKKLDQRCVIFLHKDEKGMPFMNFKIVNAKNIWMEFKKLLKYGISMWHIYVANMAYPNHWLSHREIK